MNVPVGSHAVYFLPPFPRAVLMSQFVVAQQAARLYPFRGCSSSVTVDGHAAFLFFLRRRGTLQLLPCCVFQTCIAASKRLLDT